MRMPIMERGVGYAFLVVGDNKTPPRRCTQKPYQTPLSMDKNTPRPTEITLHQQSGVLDVAFDDGRRFALPVEYLRVFSPSAEVRGHGPGQEVLQTGKRAVAIKAVGPRGGYPGEFVF